MSSNEQILENAARDGSIDIAEWPRVLESLLQKLHDIVHNDFPLPAIPSPEPLPSTIDPEVVASTPPTLPTSDESKDDDTLPDANENEPPPNSQSSTKENDEPTDIAAARIPVPGFQVNHSQQLLSDSVEPQSGPLPPDLSSLYTMSIQILERDFAHSPPYTIQRLAELVLHPKKHYRFLPAYLRALDRIVSVSSPISDFPLPTLHTPSNTGFLANGDSAMVNGVTEREGLGSDESLGGALLTPIPWLRNTTVANAASTARQAEGELHSESTETIDGPNGAGSIETVTVTVNGVPSATSLAHTSPAPASPTLSDQSDASSSSSSTEAQLREQGGVTQGELLRQEQEAGVVPLTHVPPRRFLLAGGAVAVGREAPLAMRPEAAEVMDDRPEDQPHAGPEEIGMEDMGPQHHFLDDGLDMQAAAGRGRSKSPQPPPALSPEPAPAPLAAVEAEQGEMDDAGKPGRSPADVEKDVAKLKEVMDLEKEEATRKSDGQVVTVGPGHVSVEDTEKMEVTGDPGGEDAAHAKSL